MSSGPREIEHILCEQNAMAQGDARLVNWGRWAGAVRGIGPKRVRSQFAAIIRQRSYDRRRRADPAPIDIEDALRVERTILSWRDERMRRVVTLHYAYRERASAPALRTVGVSRSRWYEIIADGRMAVGT